MYRVVNWLITTASVSIFSQSTLLFLYFQALPEVLGKLQEVTNIAKNLCLTLYM